MASEIRSLESLCSLVVDCPHSTPAWTTSGYIVLRNQNIRNGRLDLSAPSFTNAEHFAGRNRRAKPTTGDIVITREAPMGEVCMIPDGLECCLGQRQVLLRPDPRVVNPTFLLFALQSPGVQHQIGWNEGTGSTVSNLRIPVLKSLSIPLPERARQDDVADILEAIDGRIDNLRQTNATLEAIAQALFNSWFVDFDPVRAKAEGREPEGMDAATAALFPAGFDDTREGSLPSGWQPIRYGDVALLSKGTVKPQEAPSTEYQHYSLPAFDAHKLPMVELGETIKSGKTPVPSGAVLVSKLNPHIPRIWFVGDVAENSVCSTEFLVWTPRANAGSAFLFCLAASQVFNSAMCQLVTGTSNSHQRVKPDQLANVEVIAASDEAISAFETIAAPLLAKVHYNRQRAATLAQLRDTLLPRLISGKLRLPEAEREIEAATA